MSNIYKYNFVLELEKKYQNKFKLSHDKKITIMPPILKKIGLFYHLAFPVIIDDNKDLKNITRPIGIILVDKNKNEKTFDMAEYEFCNNLDSFEKSYYIIDNNSPYWPNKTRDNEEFYKVILDLAQSLYKTTSFFKKPKQEFYDNYVSKLKSFLPENYWIFYEQLKTNKINLITQDIINKRKKADAEFIIERKKQQENLNKQKLILKNKFKENVLKQVKNFIKKEIIPSLKGSGSYTKLLFYTELGKYAKSLTLNNYENCFNPFFSDNTLTENTNKVIEDIKYDILKIVSKACKNIFYKDIAIDTISKVLIVFLNALLIEELNNNVIETFESEISECISIYKEDNNRIKNIEAKKFLDKTFESLCSDYYTVDKNKLSDVFFGYLFTHNNKN